MPYYTFVAKDQHGRNYTGNLFGATEQAVFFRLQKLGYVVLSVTERDTDEGIQILPPRITLEDVVLFSRLLSTVIATGLPAVDALAALEEQTENPTFKRTIRKVREDVEKGESLSNAFEKHPKAFPHFFVSMVRSGEAGGNLAEVLDHLADYLEKDHDLRRNIRSAFTYPKFVVTLMIVLTIVLFYKVFPVLAEFYAEAPENVKIPHATKLLMNFSLFIADNWTLVLVVLGTLVASFFVFRMHRATKPIYDRLMITLPVVGPINKRVSITRSVRTLGSMLKCGVPLMTSLESTKNLANNAVIGEDIEKVMESVETGGTISSPLRLSTSFPPIAVYMISVGEHSGRLPELLHGCANALDKEIDHLVKQLLIALEPALIVLIAIMVAFMAIALYLPIFSSITAIQ